MVSQVMIQWVPYGKVKLKPVMLKDNVDGISDKDFNMVEKFV